MSWLFSQALVEEFLEDTCLDGEPSAPLSGNPTQPVYLPPDKMTEYSRLSRYGMTFKPLTADRGEALLTSYLEAFPVRTYQQQAKAQESTGSEAECGEKWRGSFTKFDPDSSSWKTHQCSLLGGLEPFSETWPRWGSMRDGACWEQPMLAHRIKETESGLWPTPTVCGNYNRKGASKTSGDGLATAVNRWPTPTARDCKGASSYRNTLRKLSEGLQAHAKQLPNAVMLSMGRDIGGQLNPMWVEWLMGWPLGWTDLKPLEMDKFQQWLEQHGTN
jgi:hypothetical protein